MNRFLLFFIKLYLFPILFHAIFFAFSVKTPTFAVTK